MCKFSGILYNRQLIQFARIPAEFVVRFRRYHDSYPQIPRSPLGTPGLQFRSAHTKKKKKKPAFLESRSAKASLTNNVCLFIDPLINEYILEIEI